MVISSVPHTFDPEEVEDLAAQLHADDPDWQYFAKHDPAGTGRSLIGMLDEDGEFVGWL